MSDRDQRPNVQLVRGIYESLKKRDVPKVLGLFMADIEITQSEEVPWGGRYRGHEGAMQFFANLAQAVTSTVTLQQCIDAGERVVAVGRTEGTVNATGKPFDVPIAHVWVVRDGKVTGVWFCIDNPTMRAAL